MRRADNQPLLGRNPELEPPWVFLPKCHEEVGAGRRKRPASDRKSDGGQFRHNGRKPLDFVYKLSNSRRRKLGASRRVETQVFCPLEPYLTLVIGEQPQSGCDRQEDKHKKSRGKRHVGHRTRRFRG